ncbi:MAG: fatty acid desaturase [Ilumatobacteraceae bacterium]
MAERQRQAVEWPTVLLLVAFFAAWGSLLAWHESVPWPLEVVLHVYLGGLWMSLGHELLHGHPTRWNSVNMVIGFLPLQFWIPFTRYKTLHVEHHYSDLTDPVDDPESFYVRPEVWESAGPLKRRWMMVLRTLGGRLLLGTPRGILRYWWGEARIVRAPREVVGWLLHIVASVAFGWWLFGVVGVSPWIYVPAFCLGGSACTNVRSFLEHKAVTEGTRSAVVKAGPVMSLLFLNNNLHHTHHAEPGLEWYKIPARHREMGSDALAAAGAGLYEGGYLQVFRTYLFRPFGTPPDPLAATRR